MPNTPGTLRFPANLDDADSLIIASNNASTTLIATATSGATTLTVASTASFATTGALTVEGEIIFYTGKTSTTFTGCVRGRDGTAAASHSIGAVAEMLIVAAHHNLLSSGIVALETKLGSGASTPTNGRLLQGTGTGSSAWNADVYVSGTLAVGTTPSPASVALNTSKNFTDPAFAAGTNYYYGQRNLVGVNLTGDSVAGWRAYTGLESITLQGSYNAESLFGRRIDTMNGSNATIANQTTAQFGVWGTPASGTATTTQALVVDVSAVKTNAGAWNIGTLRMVNINGPQLAGGTLSGTNLYGLYMADYGNPAGTWTNKYALYVSGGTSYHAGSFGIGTTTPHSPLRVLGAIATVVNGKTSNYTLSALDSVVIVDASSGPLTMTLPTAVGINGRRYSIKKMDATSNAVTVATTSSQTIDGATTYPLPARWDRIEVVSDGANWVIV